MIITLKKNYCNRAFTFSNFHYGKMPLSAPPLLTALTSCFSAATVFFR
jgi:hypothetical protein